MNDFGILDVLRAIFVMIIAVGIIWVISESFGALIPTSIWLLIIGLIGIFAIYIFVRMRKTE